MSKFTFTRHAELVPKGSLLEVWPDGRGIVYLYGTQLYLVLPRPAVQALREVDGLLESNDDAQAYWRLKEAV